MDKRHLSERPVGLTAIPEGYDHWLGELKARIHSAQQRAALAVNRELVLLYWQMGRDILARQSEQGWGAKVVDRLAHDLRAAFPDMKSFSLRNLKYMRAFAEAWPDAEFVQQASAQLPWYHPWPCSTNCPALNCANGMLPKPLNTIGRAMCNGLIMKDTEIGG